MLYSLILTIVLSSGEIVTGVMGSNLTAKECQVGSKQLTTIAMKEIKFLNKEFSKDVLTKGTYVDYAHIECSKVNYIYL